MYIHIYTYIYIYIHIAYPHTWHMVVTNGDGDDTALELVVTPSELRHFGCYFWDGLEPFPVSLAPSQDFYGKAVADPRREGHIKQCASGPGKLGVATGNTPRFITIYVLACVLMRLDSSNWPVAAMPGLWEVWAPTVCKQGISCSVLSRMKSHPFQGQSSFGRLAWDDDPPFFDEVQETPSPIWSKSSKSYGVMYVFHKSSQWRLKAPDPTGPTTVH